MHSAWSRANAVGTFFGTVAAVLCIVVAVTDLLHASEPAVSIAVLDVKKLSLHKGRYDQAALSVALHADLRSVFSWNTKQLFVYLQAEYPTPDNAVNQVVLWDKVCVVAVWVRVWESGGRAVTAARHAKPGRDSPGSGHVRERRCRRRPVPLAPVTRSRSRASALPGVHTTAHPRHHHYHPLSPLHTHTHTHARADHN
jgi:hypothetical protein